MGGKWAVVIRRLAPAVMLTLAVTAVVVQALAISAMKKQPRYDEVAYSAVARSYQREGGVVATIRCHLQGRCVEDNRSPMFELLLQTVANDSPGFYATAKLFNLATGLLLMLAGFVLSRRKFGPLVAVGVVVVWGLMPSMGELSSRILADLLFAAIILAGVHAIAACQGKGIVAWLGMGAWIGVAYLTKGNGHLLFPALFCVAVHHDRLKIIRRPEPYLAVVAFLVVTSFLLYRNVIVYKNPFHNFNERLLWLDNWEESWAVLRNPEKYRLGLGFLLERHSIWELAWRGLKGAGHTIGVIFYSAGLGITSLKHPEAPLTAAGAVPIVATGVAIVALAGWGLRRNLTTSRRLFSLAVMYTLAWFIFAFAIGQQGAGEIGVRYVLPLVVLLTPFAVEVAMAEVWPRFKGKLAYGSHPPPSPPSPHVPHSPGPATFGVPEAVALLVLALALVVKIAWFAPGAMRDPRTYVEVPPHWDQTSRWLAAHLKPGERFAFPYTSYYSTFDQPFPEPDMRWIYLYRMAPDVMMRDLDRGLRTGIDSSLVGPPGPIDKLFIDSEDALLGSYQDKFSPERDGHGPLRFLTWPRCFADDLTPSRFLVFCRPAAPPS